MVQIKSVQGVPEIARPWCALCEKFGFKNWGFDFEQATPDPDKRLQIRAEEHLAPANKVAEIRAAMRRGDPIKPNIVTRDGWLVDGNTTTRAAKLERRATMPAIVLDVDYATADANTKNRLWLLGVAANARHGVGISRADMRAALKMAGAGTSLVDATRVAAMIGTTEKMVRDVVAEGRAETRAHKLGVDLNGHLSATTMQQLGRVSERTNDKPMLELFKLTVDAGLKSSEIADLSRRMQETKSEDGAMDVLANERQARQSQISAFLAGQKARPSYASKLRQRLGFITGYSGDVTVLVEWNPDLVKLHMATISDAIEVLTRLNEAQMQCQAPRDEDEEEIEYEGNGVVSKDVTDDMLATDDDEAEDDADDN